MIVAIVTCCGTASAADKPKPKAAAKNESPILATVDGQPIHADEVERAAAETQKRQKLAGQPSPALMKQALDLAVNQRLVERALKRDKLLPSAKQLDAAIDAIRRDALSKFPSWEAYLKDRGQSEASLRWLTAWRWGWNAYLSEHLTDKACEDYFEAHKAEFDGTELRVSHILFKLPETKSPEAAAPIIAKVADLRKEIVAGKIEFAVAARQHSTGPSAKDGGDLGFIPRRGVMAEEFSQAAFALKQGDISEPVVSPFGVHLIHVTEVRPGSVTWQEARAEIEPHVIQQLFERVAAEERSQAKVVYK